MSLFVDHSAMKLGRQALKIDPQVPALARMMATAQKPVPVSADWSHGITNWGVMRNDQLGDCTACGVAHFLQAMSAAARKEFTASDAEVAAFYSASTGYDPNDASTDRGGIEPDVLRFLLKNGFCGRHIVGFGFVDPRDLVTMKHVVADLGGAYIGVALPVSAQSQAVWGEGGRGGDASAGSWGGHCVYVCGFDANYVHFVSWGKLMKMTWAFWHAYVDEAYGILWAAMIKDGKSPAGIDVSSLSAEVAHLRAVPQ